MFINVAELKAKVPKPIVEIKNVLLISTKLVLHEIKSFDRYFQRYVLCNTHILSCTTLQSQIYLISKQLFYHCISPVHFQVLRYLTSVSELFTSKFHRHLKDLSTLFHFPQSHTNIHRYIRIVLYCTIQNIPIPRYQTLNCTSKISHFRRCI